MVKSLGQHKTLLSYQYIKQLYQCLLHTVFYSTIRYNVHESLPSCEAFHSQIFWKPVPVHVFHSLSYQLLPGYKVRGARDSRAGY